MTATGSVAALPASIYAHGQSTLPDGSVVTNGGYGKNTLYVYTPNKNEWETAATVPTTSVSYNGQSTLLDGRIMVSVSGKTYIYTSDANVWATASPVPASFNRHGQSTLNDGRVFIGGGYNGSSYLKTTYIYKVDNNIWINASPMPATFGEYGQSILSDGKVLVSGGYTVPGNVTGIDTAYLYTFGNDSWTNASPMLDRFGLHSQSILFDGRLLISGGLNSGSANRNTTYIYDNDTWVRATNMPAGFRSHGQSTLADGRVLISGGTSNGSTGFNAAYIYTPTGWEDFQANRGSTELIDK